MSSLGLCDVSLKDKNIFEGENRKDALYSYSMF